MAVIRSVKPKRLFMGKLSYGSDLLEEITDLCSRQEIKLGRVEALGAVQKARLGFYDQQLSEYKYFMIDRPLEITKLMGNISLKDGKVFVHAHITLADATGKAYGGHLAQGTVVFASEILIEAFEGSIFERFLDEKTGLPLWKI